MSGFPHGDVSAQSSAERQTGRHTKCVGSALALKRILELKNLCKLSQEVNPLPYPLSPPDCSNNMNHSTLHMADQEIFILKHQFSIGFFPLEQSIIKINLFSHDIPIFYMKSKLPD